MYILFFCFFFLQGMSEVDRLTNQIMVCRSHDSKKETADCLTQRGGLYRKVINIHVISINQLIFISLDF